MVYLCTDLIAALGAVVQTTRVVTAWSKISGLQSGVSVPGSGPGDRGFNSHPPHHTSYPSEFAISFSKCPSPFATSLLLAQSYSLDASSFAISTLSMRLT